MILKSNRRAKIPERSSFQTLRALHACVMLLFWSLAVPAAADEQRDAAVIEEAEQALERRECKAAWDLTWPLAKAGNSRARHFLYISVASGQLAWPGVTLD